MKRTAVRLRQGRKALWRCLFWAVLFWVLPAFAATGAEPIRVGAWNLEVLGSPFDRDYPRERRASGFGVARDAKRIAGRIRALNLDVLALIEINNRPENDRRRANAVLDATWNELNRQRGCDWRYVLFANRNRLSTRQHTGLAWNRRRVRSVGRDFRIAVRDLTPRDFAEWDRHPHAMKFSRGDGRTDFVVVPIHMKAGRGERAVSQRRNEARALVAELREIRRFFGDEDVILIGDFNLRDRNEPAGRIYRRQGGLYDLNYADRATHISGRPLDRAYIPRSQRGKEFAGVRAVEIFAPGDPDETLRFRRDLSDHWPLVLTFRELADDD